jgi:hypothetical protein
MAADIVNLRQFRKQKARSEKEKQAEQNRLSFGRAKAEKNLTSALNEKAEKALDQGRLEKPDDGVGKDCQADGPPRISGLSEKNRKTGTCRGDMIQTSNRIHRRPI